MLVSGIIDWPVKFAFYSNNHVGKSVWDNIFLLMSGSTFLTVGACKWAYQEAQFEVVQFSHALHLYLICSCSLYHGSKKLWTVYETLPWMQQSCKPYTLHFCFYMYTMLCGTSTKHSIMCDCKQHLFHSHTEVLISYRLDEMNRAVNRSIVLPWA